MKIGLINLGCPKNQVDSEIMLGLLKDAGFELTPDEEAAEIIVVNTCGFIDSAKEESIHTLLQIGELKKGGGNRFLIAAGCLTQRYRDELLKEMPEIDAVVGTGSIGDIVKICEGFQKSKSDAVLALSEAKKERSQHAYISEPGNFNYEELLPRIRISPSHTAFVKISEGCDHTCSFCIIPALRGKQRSRSIDSIVREVEEISEKGGVEINLVAQDTTAYGRDIRESNALARLLRRLVTIRGIKWIRLLYTYPGSFTRDLIDVMAREEKVCKYIDMPVQHINDDILRRMHRGHTRKGIYRTIETLREKIPDVVLRTSIIVGFPGETEARFSELVEFVKDVEFDRLGVFTYSNEEGTEAYSMPDQIKEREKKKRRDILMKIQQKISLRKNQRLVGSKQIILIDGPSRDVPYLIEGRTYAHAPEVDGFVYITDTSGNIPVQGEIISVEITEAHPYDLVGRIYIAG